MKVIVLGQDFQYNAYVIVSPGSDASVVSRTNPTVLAQDPSSIFVL